MRFLDEHQLDLSGMANNQRLLKEKNIRNVFSIINYHRGISRIQISKITGLTPTTITSLVDELLRMELVQESGHGVPGAAGRKPIMLQINPEGVQIPVFRYRADGIMFSLFDLSFQCLDSAFIPFQNAAQTLPSEDDCPVQTDTDGEEYVSIMLRQLREHAPHLNMARVRAMCIVIPGSFEWEEGRFSSSVMRVRGTADFVYRFQKEIGGVPLLVGDESNSLGYAQYTRMCSDTRDLVFVNEGAGLGAGIILNGEIYTGQDGVAGEIGHQSIDLNGKRCTCGNRGCAERYVSQPAILNRVRAALSSGVQSSIADCAGDDPAKLTWKEVCEAYRAGDSMVCELIDQHVIHELTFAISNMTAILNINQLVLGGGIEEMGDRFLENLRAECRHNGFAKGLRRVQIRYPDAEAGGASLGAAKYFVDKHMVFSI